jgi:glyoxylase-like metal-dependent hydrolase (beta-lactamase superfamily II)
MNMMTLCKTRLLRQLAAVAALALAAAVAQAQAVPAQAVPAQAVPDDSKVEVKATRVAEGFYTLEGRGGTIGVLVGPDGVLMVDTQFATLSDKIATAIRQLTPQPIRFVVNTHVHGDHTGGNENFGRKGATIIAREELRNRLMHPNPQQNGQPVAPTAAIGLPSLTYTDRLVLHMDGQEVQLLAVPRAHTDGDTMVWFPGFDAVMTGDFYRSVGYPNVDIKNGGSLQGLIDGLGTLIGRAGPNTRIIPGHGPTVDRLAVMAHRDLVLTVRERVAALLAQGKSEEEVVAAKVTADLDAHIQQPGTTAERFVRQVYAELAPAH